MASAGTGRRAAAWQPIWAVRRDWPDGSHELVLPRGTRELAARAARGDRRFWRKAPVRPDCSAVVVSVRDFELHARRQLCKAPDCPQPTDTAAIVVAVVGRW
jgi:hypothetical protein